MTRSQLHLQNNHLSVKLLEASTRLTEGEQAILELLCTDSIYSIKDDFDRGIDDKLWVTRNMALADHDPFGVLYGTSPEVDPGPGSDNLIRTRFANFFPNRRATLQVRAQIAGNGAHAELGFVGDDTNDVGAAVTLDTNGTVRRGAESFGLALRSPLVSGWNVVSGGSSGTTRTAVTTRVAETGWATFLVAINEQGETRLWINGQNNNEVAIARSMRTNGGHYLWFHVLRGLLSIDYCQAWQERSSL